IVFNAVTDTRLYDEVAERFMEVDASWLSAGGSPLVVEKLQYSNDGGITWQDVNHAIGANGTSITLHDPTLTSTANIQFRVINQVSSGAVTSQQVTIDTVAPDAPVIGVIAGDDEIEALERPSATVQGTSEANAFIELSFSSGFTRHVQADGNGDWSYSLTAADFAALGVGAHSVTATASDLAGNTNGVQDQRDFTILTLNSPPVFTSGTAVNFLENRTGTVYTATATDADGDALVYSLAGTDAALFDIDASTGVVTFKNPPSYGAPADAGANNVYDITITVSDGINSSAPHAVQISVRPALTAINLSDIAAGNGGFVINGQAMFELSGYSVASAGDVNGDGLDDLIVGAFNSEPAGGPVAGRSYVVFGKADNLAVDLSAVANGIGGFVINGQMAGDQSGYSVASAGDVNGDGLADLIVGAPYNESTQGAGAGRSYVIFGKADGTAIDLADVAAGNGGFAIDGQATDDNSGYSVASAGDVNGDGLDDLIVGAYKSDSAGGIDAGRSYVVFGKADGALIDLSAVANGIGGFVINGEAPDDSSGVFVASAGDVNGDGLDDLIVGAHNSDPMGGINAGRSYVVFGKADGTAIDLTAVAAGVGGFVINGQAAGDESGLSVASAGDVNGDGLADLIVGARASDTLAGPDAGRSYVVFGKADGSAIDLSAVAAGVGGFVINGQAALDESGWSVASAGDVNGDGLDDLIVGAYQSDPITGEGAGRSYVVYGKADGTAIDLSAVADGIGGFVINGEGMYQVSGRSVASAGDVDGDGLADLIIGAPAANPAAGTAAGRSYVILSSQIGQGLFGAELTQLSGSGADVLHGGSGADRIAAGAGDDTIMGGGGADVLYGGAGNDTFVLNASNIAHLGASRIDGGNGRDTVVFGPDVTGLVDLRSLGGSSLKSIEALDLTGGGNVNARVSVLDLLQLEGNSAHNVWNSANWGTSVTGNVAAINGTNYQQVLIKGNVGDTFWIDGNHNLTLEPGGMVHADGRAYQIYNDASRRLQLLVDSEVTVNLDSHRPVFSSGNTASVFEGILTTTTVYDANATDDVAVTHYSLAAGGHNDLFDINASTGVVTFKAVPSVAVDTVYHITVYAHDSVGSTAQVVAVTVKDLPTAPALSLGTWGQLILPVVVEGKTYYVWDLNGDGTHGGSGDQFAHDTMNALFRYDVNGVLETGGNAVGEVGETDNTYRYASINGVHVALPTYGGPLTPISFGYQNGTAVSSGAVNNPGYDDLLAIWDAYNGNGTGNSISGTPAGWSGVYLMAATPHAPHHVIVNMGNGYVNHSLDNVVTFYAALQVLSQITSGSSASVAENTAASAVVYDAEGWTSLGNGELTWSIVGGTDAALLTIDARSGEVRFLASPDYEAPTDGGANNTYRITVRATTSNGGFMDKNVVITVTDAPDSGAGDPMIDLGTWGQLIHGVQVEGKWYYVWDRNDDGSHGAHGHDTFNYGDLNAIFRYNVNGVLETAGNAVGAVGSTDNTFRYATINGISVALPTQGAGLSGIYASTSAGSANGTAVNSGDQSNAVYDDLLAIWDAHNGSGASLQGTPSHWWSTGSYASSTPTLTGGHATVALSNGELNDTNNTHPVYVVLQVLDANAPVFLSGGTASMLETAAIGTVVYDANANDGDGGGVDQWIRYTLGGTDAAFFNMDASTGVVTLAQGLDHEIPLDAGANNVYDITITATDVSNNTTQRNVAITVNNVVDGAAGHTVIDLGTLGQLIRGVQVEGKWYYVLDLNRDGVHGSGDAMTHHDLGAMVRFNINGVRETDANAVGLVGSIDNTFRYFAINGVTLALPTYGAALSGANASPAQVFKNGTAVNSPTQNNPTYDDMLAIWDAHNGNGTGTGTSGVPSGWGAPYYWTATPSSVGHTSLQMNNGHVHPSNSDADMNYVVFQVL
ncbi:cadherin domain-containing protein, partial [Hydrogenophaga sp.]|uniref:beta strand repeat-containing protein n=1 Tax=Hydrogenophaga sp. TaxID=1904254 RepID=UPI003F72F3FB